MFCDLEKKYQPLPIALSKLGKRGDCQEEDIQQQAALTHLQSQGIMLQESVQHLINLGCLEGWAEENHSETKAHGVKF